MIGTARVDPSGRIQHSRILRALRWCPGDVLLVDIAEDPHSGSALLITPERARHRSGVAARPAAIPAPGRPSRCRIDARGAITLPAPARALCAITTGSTIVLVAEPATNRLIVQPTARAVRLLVAHLHAPTPGHIAPATPQTPVRPEGHPR